MSDLYGFDAYSPKEVAARVREVCVVKARLPLLTMWMLSLLAGGFIGLGALYYTLVVSDATLGFATSRVLGGMCFSLGLILVVVAGAELFTGNNLLAMAWVDRCLSTAELLRNWGVVCAGNFVGAAGLALLVWLAGHPSLNQGGIAQTTLEIAELKCSLSLQEAFFRGVLCNVLVCMAVWMTLAGRSVTDKFIAIVFPISAFVAAGFEHSIANMYFVPYAMFVAVFDPHFVASRGLGPQAQALTWAAFLGRNLLPVTIGNVIGGAALVGAVYWFVYLRSRGPAG